MATTRKAGDDNAAPEIPVDGLRSEPAIVPGAADTKGAKLIRTTFRKDTFVIDGDTTITGEFQEFPASRAAEIIALCRRSRVDVVVTDKEN